MKTLILLFASCLIATAANPGVVTYPPPGSLLNQIGSTVTFQWGSLAAPYQSFSYCVGVINAACYSLEGEGTGTSFEAGAQNISANGDQTISSLSINLSSIPPNTPTKVYVEIEGSPTGWDGTSYHNVMLTKMAFTFTWSGSGAPISFAYSNLSHPALTPNLIQGDTWNVTMVGAPGSAVTVAGTTPGGSFGATVKGYADSNGNFSLSGGNPNVAVGTWVETWAIGSFSFPPISFVVLPPSAVTYGTTNTQMYYPPTDPVPDDYTGGTITLNAMQRRWKTTRGHIEIPRADNIEVGQVTYAKPEGAADGSFRYSYSFDNSEVYAVRLGDIDILNLRPTGSTQPEGWYSLATGWCVQPGKNPSGSTQAEYSITTRYRPGLMPLHLAGPKVGQFNAPEEGLTRIELEFAASRASIFQNSHTEYVIGPAFKPDATPATIKETIGRWVSDYGMTFLQPYLDTGKLDAVQPSSKLEQDVLDCLRAIL